MTEFIALRVDETQLNRLGEEYAKRAALQFAQEVAEEARRLCPVDSGRMRSQIKVINVVGGYLVMADTHYAIYVHEGTGAFAQGRGTGKTSWVFTPDGGTTWVRTRGQPAQPFITQALDIVAARWGGVN